jgi:hypothetical protein
MDFCTCFRFCNGAEKSPFERLSELFFKHYGDKGHTYFGSQGLKIFYMMLFMVEIDTCSVMHRRLIGRLMKMVMNIGPMGSRLVKVKKKYCTLR